MRNPPIENVRPPDAILDGIHAALYLGDHSAGNDPLAHQLRNLREADLGRSIVLLGSEGRGLSEDALSACRQTVRIPMEAKCESLNVAAAAAAVLWEGYR